MASCRQCKNQIDEQALFCPECGGAQRSPTDAQSATSAGSAAGAPAAAVTDKSSKGAGPWGVVKTIVRFASGWFIYAWLWRKGKFGKLISVAAACFYALLIMSVIAGSNNTAPVASPASSTPINTFDLGSGSSSAPSNSAANAGDSNASGSGNTSSDSSSSDSSTTLFDKQGTGQWTSPTFNPTGDWQISYTYDCSHQGGSGNFIVDVYGPGNMPSVDGVNELQSKGSGTTSVHDVTGNGSYIQVNSECDWHITGTGPGSAAQAGNSDGRGSSGITLMDHQGSGQWTSPTFAAPSDWQIAYTYDCSSFGSAGNFMVYVYGPGNTPSADGVNEMKTSGQGTTYIHDVSGAGSYISVNSECDWHITATG